MVVYGSSGAGIAAAVQAARDGFKTILVEPGIRIGGMTTGGLGATDIGDQATIGGFAKEFYQHIYQYYKNPSVWKYETRDIFSPKHRDSIYEENSFHFFFEPSVALKIATDFLEASGVTVLTKSSLNREATLRVDHNRISGIPLKEGGIIWGKYFVDASYEGDLMGMAGIPYFLGRENNRSYGETLNGYLPHPVKETQHLDPFVVPGVPASGLLPGVDSCRQLSTGEGDRRIQAYNFRLCLTDVEENRIPIECPENYNPLHYELLARHMLCRSDRCQNFPFFKRTPVPNRKTDSNNLGMFSTDYVGKSHEWPTANDARRAELWQEHRDYTMGLLWFLGHDSRFPESWKEEVRQWGLAKDEFRESNSWPSQLYVREARRMKSDYVVTENDCFGKVVAKDPVAMGSYALDSHQVTRFVDDERRFRAEGGFWKKCKAYPISYRSIIPPQGYCPNLVVPVCLSATHAAFGSIRMEPVFMMLGQAAAAAIRVANNSGASLQDIDYTQLKHHLRTQGAILSSPQLVEL